MSGRIQRQYLEEFLQAQERTMRGQPGADAVQAAQKNAQDRFDGIKVSERKGTYRGWVKDSVANAAQGIAGVSLPQDVKGGLRMSRSSRDKIAQAQAYQQQQIGELRGIFDGKARSWHGDAASDRMQNIAGATNQFLPNGVRFMDGPSPTKAQEGKMMRPGTAQQLARQEIADEPEDRGIIGRFLGA